MKATVINLGKISEKEIYRGKHINTHTCKYISHSPSFVIKVDGKLQECHSMTFEVPDNWTSLDCCEFTRMDGWWGIMKDNEFSLMN